MRLIVAELLETLDLNPKRALIKVRTWVLHMLAMATQYAQPRVFTAKADS